MKGLYQKQEPHKHTFAPRTIKVPVYSTLEIPGQGRKRSNRAGYDKLKQFVCECGTVETVDLERTKI